MSIRGWFVGRSRLLAFSALTILITVGTVLAASTLYRYGRIPLPIKGLGIPAADYVEPREEKELGHLGPFTKWSKVEIPLHGPAADARDEEDNPFQIRVDVTFTGPTGQSLTVPAFYDGDGQGGDAGNVWKVRFAPDASGNWRFSSASSHPQLAGYSGAFQVTEPVGCRPYQPGDLPDLTCSGFLHYEEGQHYLKFSNGDYWLKGGIDDPENFLGRAFGGWAEKREAIDFLRDHGVNSIYFVANNIRPGDRNDTWPWLGDRAAEAKEQSDRFNVARLQQWESFFTYVQKQGIVLHFVLADDSAWHDFDHYLYYREMVARFAHHPALIWNIGEEANEIYSDSQAIKLAQMLRQLDPYDHPITVHRKPRWPFLGNQAFDLTSIQAGDGASDLSTVERLDLNRIVADHRRRSADAGHPIPVMIDETPRVAEVNERTRYMVRSHILYPIYLAGGNYELHYFDAYGQGGDVTLEALTPMLQEMHHLRRFLEQLPFQEMAPCNELISPEKSAYCFGKAGDLYAVYSASGEPFELDFRGVQGEVSLQWFNPQTAVFADPLTLTMDGGQRLWLSPPQGKEVAAVLKTSGSNFNQ
ncbi:MAG TPA: DUF5060 domain-containing protein [Candidatus Sulfomarinibacteraceae bacterium]|nr:DUF5060 domain-containing protein [Candidatus Sulfomarinibacteraceae bacterium]